MNRLSKFLVRNSRIKSLVQFRELGSGHGHGHGHGHDHSHGHGHGHGHHEPHAPEFHTKLGKLILVSAFLWILFRAKENNGQILGYNLPWEQEHHHEHIHFKDNETVDSIPVLEHEEEEEEEEEDEE
jgi:hypothetical protein